MNTITISDESVEIVWSKCVESYLRYGRKLAFPKDTDPTKTYQWRYARSLALKFLEWEFDAKTIDAFIDIAVAHANKANRLNKGLAALHQNNLLEICYDELGNIEKANLSDLEQLRVTRNWFDAQVGDKDPVKFLLKRKSPHEYCNLTIWYEATKLQSLFLSLSKSCGQALAKLSKSHEHERALFPKSTKLYLIRTKFLEDNTNKRTSKKLFQQDWRELCQ